MQLQMPVRIPIGFDVFYILSSTGILTFLPEGPDIFGPLVNQPTVLRTDRSEVIDPDVSLLSDSKGFFDALNNELPQDDKKSAVEMPISEEILKRMKGEISLDPAQLQPFGRLDQAERSSPDTSF